MKKSKYLFVFCMLLAITLAGGIFTMAYVRFQEDAGEEEGLRVVTSFYPVYIAAQNVIDHNHDVTLENLSEPQTGCLHDYQLTPQDMILLSHADVFIVNGGGIEHFLTDVAKAYPNLTIIQAAEGVELLEENPHAWMDTELYRDMVDNIAEGLSRADSGHAEEYRENARTYGAKIDALTSQIEVLKDSLAGQNVVIFHEAFEYVAGQYGMNPVYGLDLDEERQVSAGEVAKVMEQIEKNQVSVVLAEELYGKDMGDTVERESDCSVSYLDSLVRGEYRADSYLTAMQKNIDLMRKIAGKE